MSTIIAMMCVVNLLTHSLLVQDPDLDANGQPKEVPLSLFEESRAQSCKQQQRELLAHMRQLRHRLAGVEDILRTVRSARVSQPVCSAPHCTSRHCTMTLIKTFSQPHSRCPSPFLLLSTFSCLSHCPQHGGDRGAGAVAGAHPRRDRPEAAPAPDLARGEEGRVAHAAGVRAVSSSSEHQVRSR